MNGETRRVTCWVLVAGWMLGVGMAQAAESPMTLVQAIDAANERSGLVEAAKRGLDVFEAKLRQADWVAWPHIELKALLSPMAGQRGNALEGRTDLSEWGVFSYTDLSGVLPLYTFGKIGHLKEAARFGVDVGRAQVEIARAEATYRVKKGFLALALARELSDVIREGREYLDKAKQRMNDMADSDDPSFDPVDRMKLRVYEAQVLTRELEAARGLSLARAAIRLTIGQQPEAEVDFATSPLESVHLPDEQTRESLVASALANRPELVALRTGVKAREAEAAMRRSAFYPELFLAGMFNFGYSNVTDRQGSPFANDPYNGYSARGALGLRYEFEIGKKIGEMREAEANAGKLAAELREAERGVRLEVGKLFAEMTDARTLVAANKDAMEAARGWIIAKIDIYDNGMGELNDVLSAVLPFFQSRLDYLKAIHDFNLAVASLERACGTVLIPVQ